MVVWVLVILVVVVDTFFAGRAGPGHHCSPEVGWGIGSKTISFMMLLFQKIALCFIGIRFPNGCFTSRAAFTLLTILPGVLRQAPCLLFFMIFQLDQSILRNCVFFNFVARVILRLLQFISFHLVFYRPDPIGMFFRMFHISFVWLYGNLLHLTCFAAFGVLLSRSLKIICAFIFYFPFWLELCSSKKLVY